ILLHLILFLSVITVLFIHALLLILIVHCNVGIVLVAVHRFMMLLAALLARPDRNCLILASARFPLSLAMMS
ncbi:hypothetical protein EAY03_23485, partial [Vibrio anguillarum]|nr:hypothetical protein [Vibrio anguillarum]